MTAPKRTGGQSTPEKTNFDQQEFINIYLNSRCRVIAACKEAGIPTSTYYLWKRRDADFKRAIEESDALMVDIAEAALFDNIDEGKESSVFFFLKKKGSLKGYGEASASDYVPLQEWKGAKTHEQKIDVINAALSDSKISPAQASALSSHVMNDVNIENRIGMLETKIDQLLKVFGGKIDASAN